MTTIIDNLLQNYKPKTKNEYTNAIQEIMQEIALMGLWRAKFFEHAAFYGGTALRILYGLNRFSEDLDFSLLKADPHFDLTPFLNSISEELEISGLKVSVDNKVKHPEGTIRSAFVKAGTLETFIRIGLSESLQQRIQSSELIKIKIEVDIDPPKGFKTQAHYLTRPVPFSIRAYSPEDLFAGKMHALLCRPYKVRVKGRDWFDLIWYITQGFSLNLHHLEARMKQSGHYSSKKPLNKEIFLTMLQDKINTLNIKSAKEDIQRFIPDPRSLDGWSKDFFMSLIPKIKFEKSNS